jgi:ABC-type multidrug transport system ATPase subunit
MTTIEIRGLVKRYRSTLAVDGLTFDVRPGTVTGFLGPNGAGKSTTMRMISEIAQTADALIVIGQGRLLAQTTVAQLSARSGSLEEAFFQLTDGATDYSGRIS